MQRISKLLLIIISFWWVGPVLAADCQAVSASEWTGVLQKLQGSGIGQIGDLNFEEFSQKAKDICWQRIQDDDSRPGFTGNRRSAYYVVSKKTVYISDAAIKQSSEALPFLKLHEAFGVLNYNDEHYELSTALHLLSSLPDKEDKKQLRKFYGETLFREDQMLRKEGSGSGSSVGGGGDLTGLNAKYLVLKSIMNGSQKVTWDFLKNYPTLNFEPQNDKSQQFVALKYQFYDLATQRQAGPLPGVRRDPKLGYQELISIYIPNVLWKKGAEQKRKLIAEVKKAVLAIFPAFENTPMRTYTPELCDKNIKVKFPETDNVSVLSIQTLRAGLITGCDLLGGSIEIRTPSFHDEIERPAFEPAPTEEEAANEVPYTCRLYIGKGFITTTQFAHKGQEGSSVSATVMPDYSTLLGYMVYREDGKLEELHITNYDGRTKKQVLKSAVKLGAAKGRVEGRALGGEKIAFACERKK